MSSTTNQASRDYQQKDQASKGFDYDSKGEKKLQKHSKDVDVFSIKGITPSTNDELLVIIEPLIFWRMYGTFKQQLKF